MSTINIVDVLWSLKFRKVSYDRIHGIKKNNINHLLSVSFSSREVISYRYAATGEKLSEVFVDTDGRILRRRDIYGSYEFTDGSLDRTQVGGGYLDSRGVFHVYVTDYQGNVIGIINAKTGTPVQFTDYYPYGIPHATAYSPEANRRKFGGKEYTSEFGFSSCDFGARLYSPLLCGFDSPDSKASEYTHISPYTYCAADPVNLIDPTGEDIFVLNYGNDLFQHHIALLIQDEQNKWKYYSVNGNNVYVSGIFTGGRPFDDLGVGSWDSPQEFLNSQYNTRPENGQNDKSVNNFGFIEGYLIKSTRRQDNLIKNEFIRLSQDTPYILLENNCATTVQRALVAGNIPISTHQYKMIKIPANKYIGEDGYMIKQLNITIFPRKAFESIIEANPEGKLIKRK